MLRLKEALRNIGMTQTAFAEKYSFPIRSINHYANGLNEPTASRIVELCQALNCSADWLLGLEEAAPHKAAPYNADDIPDTLTVAQMAKRINKHRTTLHRWDLKGILPAGKTPTGRRFYTRKQLLGYIRNNSE